MDYYVNSSLRLRLFFDTPNHLAVALVMAWGVSVYLLSFAKKRNSGDAWTMTRSEIVRFTCFLLIIIVLTIGLSATYSRSGMVAFLAVACVLWRSRDARHWIVMSLVVLVFCFALMPEAGGRFTSIEPLADKSISHRFDVWRGTLAMSLEKPWTGFGKGGFGEALTVWHLPDDSSHVDTRYRTAVNAPMTILGYWGYPALFGYLCGWLLLLIAGFRGLWHGNKAVAACFIVQFTFLIGGFFTHLHQSWILNLILLASICGTMVFQFKEAQVGKLFFRRWLPIAAATSAAMCALLAVAALWIFPEGYTLRDFSLGAHGKSTGQGWALVPDKPNGSRLVWFVSHGPAREPVRLLCRPLAKQGWEVFVVEAGRNEILRPEIVLQSNPLLANKINRCVAGGIGDEGLAALALASTLAQEGGIACDAVVVNIESYWPFAEFNPRNTIKTAGGQVLLAYERASRHYAEAANALAGLGRQNGRQIDLLPLDVSGERGALSALRTNYFEQISLK